MPNSKYYLRPEAGPVPYSKHHKRAQQALDKIIGALYAASRNALVSSEGASINSTRTSQIFFVSGEPGSGKSTLYLTLRAMLSKKKEISSKYTEEDFSTLKEAIRWLDPLDLEVAGDEGENLLASVLVRLIDVLTKQDTVSNTVLSKPCDEAIKDLEELATDIGIAWEGNLQARAGALDPDTFSVEVMRTQRARLRVNERLKDALDKLAASDCYGCEEGTLFVLPVDDFYLKPDASLRLLRLLRMVSIPRLFFLVMGDITTVEALFVEKSLADWTAVAGPRTFTPKRLQAALARARELRARYLRKLLPPEQRAKLEVMEWCEALKFKPTLLDGKEPENTLQGLLNRTYSLIGSTDNDRSERGINPFNFLISLDDGLTEPTLESVGQAPKNEKDYCSLEEKHTKEALEAYTALQILDATPREIMDLWLALNAAPTDPVLSLVEDGVRLVIEEQNFLNEEEQEILEGVLPTRHYSLRDVQYNMDRLSLEPDSGDWIQSTEEERDERQLWFRNHRAWNLTVNRKLRNGTRRTPDVEQEDSELYDKLPPRPTAWIVLLHDLAWIWKQKSIAGNLVERLCQELNNYQPTVDSNTQLGSPKKQQQALNPSIDLPLWAVWRDGSTYRHLPMPRFETFRELDRFLYVWSRGIEQLDPAQPEANLLKQISSLWALAGWIVLAGVYKYFAKRGDDWFETFAEITGPPDELFGKFKEKFKEKHTDFEYPGQTDGLIEKWVSKGKWPKLVSGSVSIAADVVGNPPAAMTDSKKSKSRKGKS